MTSRAHSRTIPYFLQTYNPLETPTAWRYWELPQKNNPHSLDLKKIRYREYTRKLDLNVWWCTRCEIKWQSNPGTRSPHEATISTQHSASREAYYHSRLPLDCSVGLKNLAPNPWIQFRDNTAKWALINQKAPDPRENDQLAGSPNSGHGIRRITTSNPINSWNNLNLKNIVRVGSIEDRIKTAQIGHGDEYKEYDGDEAVGENDSWHRPLGSSSVGGGP